MSICMKNGIVSNIHQQTTECENCEYSICKAINQEIESQNKLSKTMVESMTAIAGNYEDY